MRLKMPELAEADQAMPVYLEMFLHPVLGGFMTLCILFAMQSTANSLLHTVPLPHLTICVERCSRAMKTPRQFCSSTDLLLWCLDWSAC
ncbi:hypothetical protein ACQU0X_32670 [Pseudovibrio ascidiaceicola]|uniref:hypothetical protein n=1 Tax=Pseudovibrio ascidiaceicola TaxID=285279 RepID=UPI003D36147C